MRVGFLVSVILDMTVDRSGRSSKATLLTARVILLLCGCGGPQPLFSTGEIVAGCRFQPGFVLFCRLTLTNEGQRTRYDYGGDPVITAVCETIGCPW